MSNYDFQYNEMNQVGADHADPKRAKEYDSKMSKFRNYEQEAKRIVNLLNINTRMLILDIGAGTGALTIEMAKHCKEITAIDVSKPMLQILQQKATALNLTNVVTVNAGFLTYKNDGKLFDRIISNAVLHHLPDFWKVIALRRIHSMLKDDGLFLLSDIVFSFDIDNYQQEMTVFLTDMENKTDKEFVRDGILHFKEEFSTFDWLLDSIIEKAGFRIKNKNSLSNTQIVYVLEKQKRNDR
jgi:putative AdoMet-dependent methyltransferase